jgi:hypothetical protein
LEALGLLRAIEADVAAVAEALRGGEVERLGAASRAAGLRPVPVSWEWIERWHRVLRPGDAITRVVALLGRPAAAGPGALEYCRQPDEEESSCPGPGATGPGERTVLRIALEGGKVKEVKLAPPGTR